tara:strand:+ start:1425 stop:2819 length:1395 start_codon:yes stop_codon:yes gene_type:complete
MSEWDKIKKEQLGDGPWTIEKALYTRDGYAAGFPNLPGGDLNTKVTYERKGVSYRYKGYGKEYEKENILNSIRSIFTEIINPLTEWADKKYDGLEITSGYRGFKTNHFAAGSGEVRSQHTLGQALDVRCKNWSCRSGDIFNWIVDQGKQGKLVYDQIIWEFPEYNDTSWVHISYINPESAQIKYEEGRISVEKLNRNKGNRLIKTIASKGSNVKKLYQTYGNTKEVKKFFSGTYMDSNRKYAAVSPEWVYPSVIDFFTNNNSGLWEDKNYKLYNSENWEADSYNFPRDLETLKINVQTINNINEYNESQGIKKITKYLNKVPYLNPPTLDDLVIRPNLFYFNKTEPNQNINNDIIEGLNLEKIVGEITEETTKTLFNKPQEVTISATFTGFVNNQTYIVKLEKQNVRSEEERTNMYNNFLSSVFSELSGKELNPQQYLFTYEGITQPIRFGYYHTEGDLRVPIY